MIKENALPSSCLSLELHLSLLSGNKSNQKCLRANPFRRATIMIHMKLVRVSFLVKEDMCSTASSCGELVEPHPLRLRPASAELRTDRRGAQTPRVLKSAIIINKIPPTSLGYGRACRIMFLLSCNPLQFSINKRLEVTIEDALCVTGFVVGTKVFHHLVRV